MEFSFTHDKTWSPDIKHHVAIQANNIPFDHKRTSYHVVSLVPLDMDEQKRVVLRGVRTREGHSQKELFVFLHINLVNGKIEEEIHEFSDLFDTAVDPKDGSWVKKLPE
jgi:hypothetical protein